MPYQFPLDLQDLVGEQMQLGEYSSEDDVLRDALRALAEEREDLAAIREAITEWRAGDDGLEVSEAFAQVRSKHRSTVEK